MSKTREIVNCECGSSFQDTPYHRRRHEATKNHIKRMEQEQEEEVVEPKQSRQQKPRLIITCICGSTHQNTPYHTRRHKATKKHIEFEDTNEEEFVIAFEVQEEEEEDEDEEEEEEEEEEEFVIAFEVEQEQKTYPYIVIFRGGEIYPFKTEKEANDFCFLSDETGEDMPMVYTSMRRISQKEVQKKQLEMLKKKEEENK